MAVAEQVAAVSAPLMMTLIADRRIVLAARLREAAAYQRLGVARRLLADPIRALRGELHRAAPWQESRTATVRLFTGSEFSTVVTPGSVGPLKYGFLDEGNSAALLELLPAGGIAVDVGAHFGYYSVLMASLVGSTGMVYAFEPSATTLAVLQRNARQFRNLEVINAGVLERDGEMHLTDFGARYSGLNTFESSARTLDRLEGRSVRVPVISLDSFFSDGERRIDFVKIDAENSELRVLIGMTDLLRRCSPQLLIEVGDIGGTKGRSRALIDYLGAVDYQPFAWDGVRLVPHVPHETYSARDLFFLRPD